MASSLTIAGIHASYGAVRVIDDVSLKVGGGETVVLLGTNGNGKSTLMKCIMGIVQPSEGSIVAEIDGIRHDLSRPHHRGYRRSRHRAGTGGTPAVPKTDGARKILLLGAFRRAARAKLTRNMAVCFETFPRLAERRRQLAGSLSGGEQQMVALGRALMLAPKILLVDEPSVGLAPILVSRTIDAINEMKQRYSLDRLDGGAEFHPGDPHRRPRLRHRPRQDRIRGPLDG